MALFNVKIKFLVVICYHEGKKWITAPPPQKKKKKKKKKVNVDID
jgi:hypothetical protein